MKNLNPTSYLLTLVVKINARKLGSSIHLPCSELHTQVKPVKGLDWHVGAIGTASWGGVLLKDVLEYAGLEEGDRDVAHIHFIGECLY